MHIRLSAVLLTCLLIASIFTFFDFAEATTETRYFRSDSATVNGLNCRKLLTSQSGSAFNDTKSNIDPEYEIQRMYLGSRVWKRTSAGVETEITSGTPIGLVYRASIGTGLQTATWACPQTTIVITDSIVIRVYYSPWDSANGFWGWNLINTTAIWQTAQLGTTILNSATWTFQYYTFLSIVPSPKRWTLSFLGDTATYDSKITGFTYGEAPSGTWHSIIWAFNLTGRRWNSVSWFVLLNARQWSHIPWFFILNARQWNSVAWSFLLNARTWNSIVWNVLLNTSTWRSIIWSFILNTQGWHSLIWVFRLNPFAIYRAFPFMWILTAFVAMVSLLFFPLVRTRLKNGKELIEEEEEWEDSD